MLIVLTRVVIIYILLLVVMRLMGKRQIGELQPVEFTITLIVAELACTPMAEASIPLSYGVIPILTLFVLHLFITKLSTHSIKVRKLLNGTPIIVISPDGINADVLKNANMNVNDLLDALRGNGYFNPNDVAFAILETNGKLSVLPKATARPLTPQDMNICPSISQISYTLICEGHIMHENIQLAGTDFERVSKVLSHYKLQEKQILLMTLTDGENLYIQPYIGKCIVDNYINISSFMEATV